VKQSGKNSNQLKTNIKQHNVYYKQLETNLADLKKEFGSINKEKKI